MSRLPTLTVQQNVPYEGFLSRSSSRLLHLAFCLGFFFFFFKDSHQITDHFLHVCLGKVDPKGHARSKKGRDELNIHV